VATYSYQADGVRVIGAQAHPLRDAYLGLLRMRWAGVIASIALAFVFFNILFACGYWAVGGIHGASGSFRDAFFFSVQTMGTIGYGAMYPEADGANALVLGESIVSVILTALSTGIVFARFSQASGMVVFSNKVAISPFDGVPTLQIRIGNDRSTLISDATIRVVMFKTEKTREGVLFYRMYDLDLVRDRTPALQRSWTAMHKITDASPLHGFSPEECVEEEVELLVSVVGTDDTSLQPVHGRRRYETKDIVWGARLADILTELADGTIELDVRRFHDMTPTEPTPSFPYPKKKKITPREA
jgi:inward rectifier potassium channel